MRYTFAAIAALALAGPAAAEIGITLGIGAADSLSTARYTCGDGAPFDVTYVNSGANSLAILPVDGEERIFVNVISGSGARYVSGGHVWWTKGDGAMLESTFEESTRDCTSAEGAAQ
ncbi:hypothetical protein E2L08_08525 [Palleronia sediminis]|uniref:C-type lysozyme inhibitor domain-containing protein n=1 Tax=Palleronia sediminis TaxID=2547833 RepID=A0A4R6A7J2_9RHOB|nr:MliC family protein [Palleronia sediminis]TDL79640.1 hypothetical protein E2L08_08525 [Palleronia sediminis]